VPVRPNQTLAALRAGRCVLGAETTLLHPAIPLLYANVGLDFIWIDLEHTLIDPERVGIAIQQARLGGITPIVRVPELRPGLVRGLLDNGAQGIILPLVEDPDAVEELVAWCRFNPDGRRGAGNPLLANDFTNTPLAAHVRQSNAEILVAVQAESLSAVERIDEIVAVEGLDVLIVGLADLSVSFSVPGEVGNPRVLEAAERLLQAASARGVATGVAGFYSRSYTEPPLAAWLQRGARFFLLFGDLGLLADSVGAVVLEAQQVRRRAR